MGQRQLLRRVAISLFSLLVSHPAPGQATSGAITGTVMDSSGAVMPGVTVLVKNEGTGVAYAALTAATGVYTAPNLNAGTYTVRITKEGFQGYERNGIHLNANAVLNVDAQLDVASTGTTVQVTASATEINTQTPTINNVTPSAQLAQLPVITRQKGDQALYGYASYNNGVGRPPFFIANGSRYIDTQPTVDGITAMSYQTAVGGSTVQTGIEATAEVSVQLANAPAEFGRPVQMTMVSRSGTNEFHGSVFAGYNGNALNARDFFASSVPFRVYNNFGTSLGGPIRKNKTFFFADYEGSRESTAAINTLNVPVAPWRNGDFNGLSQKVTNPFTGQPFPDNVIPANLISPVSRKIQSLYFPKPNYGPATLQAGNYRDLLHPGNNGVTIFDKFDARADHYFSPRDIVYGRVSYSRMPINAYVAPSIPPFGFRTSLRVANSAVLNWSHTFSPTLLNVARFGYTRDNNQITNPVSGDTILQQVGIQGITVKNIPTYPSFNVTGLSSPYVVPFFGGAGTNFEWTDSLSWIHGSHTIKAGFDVIRDRSKSFFYGGSVYGSYNFSGAFTGVPYADFLLGIPQTTGRVIPSPIPHQFGNWWAAYFQDQFKVTRALTINYGLRWEAQEPYHDNRGLMTSFNPATGAVVVADEGVPFINPLFPKRIPVQKASEAGYPSSSLLTGRYGYFYPRVGFAYRPFSNGKTAFRGGYGIYGLTTYGSAGLSLTGGPFAGSESFSNKIVNGTPLFSFPSPFLTNGQTPAQSVSGIDPNLRIGYMQQWNLAVEREVAGFALGATYIGTRTVNIPYSRNLNQPYPGSQPFTPAALRYPAYISVSWTENGGSQRYNALQLHAKRTYGKNLFVNAGFTWAKDLTDTQDTQNFAGSSISNAYDRAAEYGPNSYLRAKRLFTNLVYALPVGNGQRWLGHAPGAVNLLLGGWRMAWNVIAESGPYYTPSFSGFDPSNTNSFGGRPDRIGPTTFAIPGCPAANPVCSNPANVGRFGNSGRNVLQAQGFTDFDLSLMKDFSLSERFALQLRATATDAFNHPNFGIPASNISSPGTYGRVTSTYAELLGQNARQIDFMLRLQF